MGGRKGREETGGTVDVAVGYTFLRKRNFIALEHMPAPNGRRQGGRGGPNLDLPVDRGAAKAANAGRI